VHYDGDSVFPGFSPETARGSLDLWIRAVLTVFVEERIEKRNSTTKAHRFLPGRGVQGQLISRRNKGRKTDKMLDASSQRGRNLHSR